MDRGEVVLAGSSLDCSLVGCGSVVARREGAKDRVLDGIVLGVADWVGAGLVFA